ncbi:ALP1-like protein isoform X1 [Tanacetum coccineum]
MVGRGCLHILTCAFWTSSVHPGHDHFLNDTALQFLRISSLAYFLLWIGFSADLLVLLLLFTYMCRGATLGLSRECMLLLSPYRLKTFLSSGPSLVNTVALTRLLRWVGLSLLCLSLENTLAVCEGRIPLEAVTGLCLLFLGLFFLSHDSDSENWVCEFRCELSPYPVREEVPRIVVGCLLAPLVAVFWTVELAGVWAGFAGYTSRGAVGVWPSWILPGPGLGPSLVVWPKPALRRGDSGSEPFILLEAVASQDLWIWHAFFGVAGLNNDINVLRQSPILNDLKVGKAPEVPFMAKDVTYKWGYYLTDGIYPEWAVHMKFIAQPGSNDVKRIRYKQAHEAARKDVE